MKIHPTLLLAIALGVACSEELVAPHAEGEWGGEGIALQVRESGATAEFDCAHGQITVPFTRDGQGRFALAGTLTLEHGGPIREGEPPDVHPARYSGQILGTWMKLQVQNLDSGVVSGPYSLRRDAPPQLRKCL